MHCGLTVVAWQFADVNPGDGGLALIPGSHKGSFACPTGIRNGEEHTEAVSLMEPPFHSHRADIGRPFLNDDGSFGGGKLGQHNCARAAL